MKNDYIETNEPQSDWDYESVVEEWYEHLYRFAFGLAGNGADAADLTQITFAVFLRKAHTIRERSRVKSWLFTTLHRRFLQQRRRAVKWPWLNLDDHNDHLSANNPVPGRGNDIDALMKALQSLKEKFRAPLVMFYLEDISYQEIADILGVPIGTVMSRLYRARQYLRAQIEVNADAVCEGSDSTLNHSHDEKRCEPLSAVRPGGLMPALN